MLSSKVIAAEKSPGVLSRSEDTMVVAVAMVKDVSELPRLIEMAVLQSTQCFSLWLMREWNV